MLTLARKENVFKKCSSSSSNSSSFSVSKRSDWGARASRLSLIDQRHQQVLTTTRFPPQPHRSSTSLNDKLLLCHHFKDEKKNTPFTSCPNISARKDCSLCARADNKIQTRRWHLFIINWSSLVFIEAISSWQAPKIFNIKYIKMPEYIIILIQTQKKHVFFTGLWGTILKHNLFHVHETESLRIEYLRN